MNKKIYFIVAIIISITLTIIQSVSVNKKYTRNMKNVYVSTIDIAKDTIILDEYFTEEKVYGSDTINSYNKENIVNSMAVTSIKKGEIITMNDFNKNIEVDNYRYIALKINGENFNANDIKVYDYVDIYFILDLDQIKPYQFSWLVEITNENNIEYSPEEEVGIFIRNVQIEYIDNANNQAQYISLKLQSPFDEIVSFLKLNSKYDVIKINQ